MAAKTPRYLEEIDLRDATSYSETATPTPYFDHLVRVIGSTKSGTVEMVGIITGVTFHKESGSGRLLQVIVYMEGQQQTVFDATQSGVWICGLTERA